MYVTKEELLHILLHTKQYVYHPRGRHISLTTTTQVRVDRHAINSFIHFDCRLRNITPEAIKYLRLKLHLLEAYDFDAIGDAPDFNADIANVGFVNGYISDILFKYESVYPLPSDTTHTARVAALRYFKVYSDAYRELMDSTSPT